LYRFFKAVLIAGYNFELAIKNDHHVGLFIISIIFFNVLWAIDEK